MHVVCLHGKVQFLGLLEHAAPQSVVRSRLVFYALCNFYHVPLQFQIMEIDGSEGGRENSKKGQHSPGGHDASAGDRIHEGSPDSLLEAQSSSQMSSECGVHSAPAHSASPTNSSSFKVPCPYRQMYSMRGRPNCSMRLHDPVSIGIRKRRRQTRQR